MNDAATPTRSGVLARGVVGELFFQIDDPVLILHAGVVEAANPAAVRILSAGRPLVGLPLTDLFADDADLDTVPDGPQDRSLISRGGKRRWSVSGSDLGDGPGRRQVLMLRDVTAATRYTESLRGLNGVARRLLSEPTPEVLYDLVAEAIHELLGAEFTAVVVLAAGSERDVAHFAYHAPRELFPARLPRAVGLLSVPLATGMPARVDDIRGHPAGVGIPVQHPPIGPLLAVPIPGATRPVGELAAANPPDGRTFDDTDEAILTELAAHAGLAIAIAEARLAKESAEEARRGFSRLALHNLRTPLAVAFGSARTLQRHGDRLDAAARSDMFDSLLRALTRVTDLSEESVLVGAVLADYTPAPVVADPGVILTQLVDGFADTARQGEVSIEIVADGTAPAMPLDRRLVQVSIENLLGNAIKHSPKRSTVTVTHRVEGGKLRVDVTDHGPGISNQGQHRIFEGFYRTDYTREKGIPGAGVGLAGVRRLLTVFGGTIGVTSQPGAGATFWVTFPDHNAVS